MMNLKWKCHESITKQPIGVLKEALQVQNGAKEQISIYANSNA